MVGGVWVGGSRLQNKDHVLASVEFFFRCCETAPPSGGRQHGKNNGTQDQTIHLTMRRCNQSLPRLEWKCH